MKIKWKELIISVAISLGVGFLSSFFTRNNMDVFTNIQKPPLTPPAWLFPGGMDNTLCTNGRFGIYDIHIR